MGATPRGRKPTGGDMADEKLAKYEHHGWGYFVCTDKKAIAVLSHEQRHLQAALEELRRSG